MTFTPIFVADRPASLKILSGLINHRGEFGILAHAFTTDNFKRKFKDFNLAKWKIGDSGIYQGKDIPYELLFGEYLKMGVTHGIIKDYYRNHFKTKFLLLRIIFKIILRSASLCNSHQFKVFIVIKSVIFINRRFSTL